MGLFELCDELFLEHDYETVRLFLDHDYICDYQNWPFIIFVKTTKFISSKIGSASLPESEI